MQTSCKLTTADKCWQPPDNSIDGARNSYWQPLTTADNHTDNHIDNRNDNHLDNDLAVLDNLHRNIFYLIVTVQIFFATASINNSLNASCQLNYSS